MNNSTITEETRVGCRKVQIRLLDALVSICEKNNLTYWLDFGTLLGAHMHKSFIPWDDDIDVSMPINDYKKFLEIAEKELPSDIFLQTPKTDKNYRQNFTKLRDCYSTFLEHKEKGSEGYHQGIYIDIFPSVEYPKMPYKLRKIILYFTVRSREKAVVLKRHRIINYSIYFLCKFVFFLFSPFKSGEVAQTPEDNGYYYSIPQKYIYPLKKIEFEGKLYAAPQKTHEYLSVIWKNYTPNPPMETRISHARTILIDTPCNHTRAINKHAQPK